MSNRTERLQKCNEKIDALFRGVELNAQIKRELEAVKAYYYNLYIEASYKENEEACIQTYELLVHGLEEIKSGTVIPGDVLKEMADIKSLKKTGIVLENIFTSLELLFWAGLACAFFSYCVLMAAPLAAVNPFFALGILSIAGLAAIFSVSNFFECVDEFKSSAPVEEEFNREKSLIMFFKPVATSSEKPSKVFEEDTHQQGGLYPQIVGMTN